jgi:hypothetical protein
VIGPIPAANAPHRATAPTTRYAGEVDMKMLALGSGILFYSFLVLVVALVAYALYFLFFRLGK